MKIFSKISRLSQRDLLFYIVVLLLIIPCTNLIPFKSLKGSYTETPVPKINADNWFSGSYQEQLEKYIAEKTLFRNLLIRINNQIDYSFFNKVNANSVIIGKENYLFEENYIKAYLGRDFIGKQKIKDKVKKIRSIQESLKLKNIDLVVVFAAGKATFYPQYIPDKYNPNEKSISNYELYAQEFKESKVNFIDFNHWFLQIRDTLKYPLYPKCGIHWSKYGEILVADSLIKYIQKMRGINMPQIIIDNVTYSSKMQYSDDDIEQGLNLLFNISDLEMAYPEFRIISDSSTKKPHVLVVSDSYYWGMFNWGISKKVFENGKFWFYNKQIFPDFNKTPLFVKDIDIKKEIEKQDVILLISTDANLFKFPFDFDDMVYKTLFDNHSNNNTRIY